MKFLLVWIWKGWLVALLRRIDLWLSLHPACWVDQALQIYDVDLHLIEKTQGNFVSLVTKEHKHEERVHTIWKSGSSSRFKMLIVKFLMCTDYIVLCILQKDKYHSPTRYQVCKIIKIIFPQCRSATLNNKNNSNNKTYSITYPNDLQ